jgi:hypothetical protein
MTLRIELPPDIEAGLLAQAQHHGLSLEAYAQGVLNEKSRERQANTSGPQQNTQPIWEVITGIMQHVPDEVFDRQPKDAASEHDHYIHGTPKRKA